MLITGGAGGLGRAIAEAALSAGARVAVADLNPASLDAFATSHPEAQALVCDAVDPKSVQDCVDAAWQGLDGVTCLVNCAGVIHSEGLLNLLSKDNRKHRLETWRSTLDANLTSTFLMTTAVAEKMVMSRRKGVVVNVSSVCARGNPGQAAYSAAKAGVDAFTRVAAKEFGPMGVRVAAVAPGFIDTPSTRAAMPEKILENWIRSVPLRRLGQVENVVAAVFSILENDYLNGCILALDGGL